MGLFEDWAIAMTGVGVGLLLLAETSCTGSKASASDTYQRACARCHGSGGQGGERAPGEPRPRDFTDAAWQRSISSEEIRATVRAGKGPMPSFEGVLTEEEIDAVVLAVRAFGGELR